MWTFWYGENLLTLLEIKPQLLGPPAHTLVKVYMRQCIKEAVPYTNQFTYQTCKFTEANLHNMPCTENAMEDGKSYRSCVRASI